MRLDVALVTRGLCDSRMKAQDAILEQRVSINGQTAKKSSQSVADSDVLEVIDPAIAFASRAGFKLYDVLAPFAISLKERICMDVGASTGGFTDVCLQQGAKKVYAVDVGRDQLLPRLQQDVRVVNMEQTNCRYLKQEMFDPQPDFACMDVSFISIKQILPVLIKEFGGIEIVALVKPQFEAGKQAVGKHGIVRQEKVHIQVLSDMQAFVESLGVYVHHVAASSILGRDGNKEFIMHIKPEEKHILFPYRQIVKDYTVKR